MDSQTAVCIFREALFPGLDLDSGLDWTLDWTHGLWLNSALEHLLKHRSRNQGGQGGPGPPMLELSKVF